MFLKKYRKDAGNNGYLSGGSRSPFFQEKHCVDWLIQLTADSPRHGIAANTSDQTIGTTQKKEEETAGK